LETLKQNVATLGLSSFCVNMMHTITHVHYLRHFSSSGFCIFSMDAASVLPVSFPSCVWCWNYDGSFCLSQKGLDALTQWYHNVIDVDGDNK